MPLFCHCLKNLCSEDGLGNVVLVVSPGNEALFSQLLKENLPVLAETVQVISGGELRSDSVLRGLQALKPECSYVAIQDAARPRTSAAILRRCFETAKIYGSGVAAHRITDSVKIADENGIVRQSLDRNLLWATETPQVFRRETLLKAYKICRNLKKIFTDEAQLLEEAGFGVKLVENREDNPKITYRHDLPNMESIVATPE